MVTDDAQEVTASSTAITLNLITMGLGTGLLTMPWGVAGASIITSCLLLAVILVLNFWTIMLLVRVADKLQEFDLGAMLSRLPSPMGPALQAVGNSIIIASQFLVLLGYTIVIESTIQHVSPESSYVGQRSVAAALVTIVVLPLSFLDQRYLAFTSSLGILANAYLICLLIWYAVKPSSGSDGSKSSSAYKVTDSDLCVFGVAKGSVTMFSLLMYTIIIQMAIPPMYKELCGRTPSKFRSCLLNAFAFLFILFAAVMICGYAAFGPSVSSSVLDDLPKDMLGSVARLAMSFCLIGCYPLNIKPMSAPFERKVLSTANTEPFLDSDRQQQTMFCNGSVAATIVIIFVVSLTSLWVNSLGPLNAINGAIQVMGYIGIIPGILGLYFLNGLGNIERASLLALIVFAAASSILGLFVTDNNVLALEGTCVMTWSQDTF